LASLCFCGWDFAFKCSVWVLLSILCQQKSVSRWTFPIAHLQNGMNKPILPNTLYVFDAMLTKPEISYTVFHSILPSPWEVHFKKEFFSL